MILAPIYKRNNASKLLLLILFLVLAAGCSRNALYKKFYGSWKKIQDESQRMVFLENRKFKEFINVDFEVFKDSKSRFKLVEKNDTVWLYTRGHIPDIDGSRVWFTHKYSVEINGDYLTLVSYKRFPGMRNFIGKYSVWVREVPNPQREKEIDCRPITYVFPEGFTGASWIAFNQEDGVAPQYDNEGNPVLRIPESGLLKTSLQKDVYATANGCYRMVVDSSNGNGFYPYQAYDTFARIDSTCCAPNENVAFVYGFDHNSRKYLNENIFNEDIRGNVITIFIGTFQERSKWPVEPWIIR